MASNTLRYVTLIQKPYFIKTLQVNSGRFIASNSVKNNYGEVLDNLNAAGNDELFHNVNRQQINFKDFEKAFKAKSTSEIIRALGVYKLCSFDFLVTKNKELIKLSRKLLGKYGFDLLMKSSFYGHFVAGETQADIKSKLSLMQSYGVGAILDYAVEADVPKAQVSNQFKENEVEKKESTLDLADVEHRFQLHQEFADRREQLYSARTYFYEGEEKCDKNMEIFLKCIDTTSDTSDNGFAAIKVTALGRPLILLRLSQILNQIQYFFDEMASSSDILKNPEIAEEAFIKGLATLGVDMSEEQAKQVFQIIDINKSGGIDVIEWHNFLTPQLQLSKLFRAKSTVTGELGNEIIASLTNNELKEMENMLERMMIVSERAQERNVRLMVDAEQTYFQPAISRITLAAMRQFNKEKPVVFNTYQCYLKNIHRSVEIDMELSRREGFLFGGKVVRGAYMEQERLRASSIGYDDPIHDTYEHTNDCYNSVLTAVLQEVRDNGANLMVATHNEGSVLHAIDKMKTFQLKPDDQSVFFGQLLGMCDAITYALGNAGYAAFKYVPYGPVEEVMPYLSRRAMENRSLMKGVVKERHMLWSELKRRVKTGTLNHDPNVTL